MQVLMQGPLGCQQALPSRPRSNLSLLRSRPAVGLRSPTQGWGSPGYRHSRQPIAPAAFKKEEGGGGLSRFNPVEVVKREQGLQSNRLPAALQEKVSGAVEELRFRVTVGDVAAKAGVKLQDADRALQALAYDAQAALEVSQEGEVVYKFARDFRSSLQARSTLLKLRPALRAAQKVAMYLVRVSFGTALLFSVALVWFAITVLLSSKDRDNRQGDRGGYYNQYYGNYNGGGLGARVYFDLTDLLIYLDPGWSGGSRRRVEQGANLTFLEAIFSFVFGDGDPNQEFEEQRWVALGQMIQDRGGVVTAEEMAPFLDPPAPDQARPQGGYSDEAFVLPALIRFGGEPVVDEATGTLVYRFPSLQVSGVTQEAVYARGGQQQRGPAELVQEETWELTAASSGQVLGVIALGAFNVIGVLTLGGLLADPQARYTLYYQGLGWVTGLMPALQVYAAAFFAIPGIRLLFNSKRNQDIITRNDARSRAARLLNSGANWVRQKLAAARQLGRSRVVRKGDVIFTTEKETSQQMAQSEAAEWERRLGARQERPYDSWVGRDGQADNQRQKVRDYGDGWK